MTICNNKNNLPYWEQPTFQPVVDSSLILWLTSDYGNNLSWNDISGYNNIGIPTATTLRTYVEPSQSLGSYFNFNGVDTSISVPDTFSTFGGMSQLTVDTWIYYIPGGTKASGRIIDKWKTSGGLYQLYRATNNIPPITGDTIGGFLRGYDSSIDPVTGLPYGNVSIAGSMNTIVPFNFNTWQQVSMVYNGNTVVFYKNGVQIYNKNATKPGLPIATSTDPLYIGALRETGNNFLGSIGEVRIYNRALSPSEILQNYNNSIFNKIKSNII